MAADRHRNRVVVVEQTYFQEFGRQPVALSNTRCSRQLQSDEQPYGPRRFVAGPTWQPLQAGWLREEGGLVLLANEEGSDTTRQPTEGERLLAESHVLEIAFAREGTPEADLGPCLYVLPGETQRLRPTDSLGVRVRCRSGQARCSVAVVPG